MEKECRRCFRSLPLTNFYPHKQMFDGYLNVCKECTKARVNKHRCENIEKIKEYDRNRPNKKERVEKTKLKRAWIRENDPEKNIQYEEKKKEWTIINKDKVSEYKDIWIKNNPEKRRAHHILNNAVRDGRLVKPEDCSACDKKGRQIEGHHDDYNKPLEVTWLCSPCHKQLHRDLKTV
jgi:hypothetical protein